MHTDFKILILVRHNLEGFQEIFEKSQVETQLTQTIHLPEISEGKINNNGKQSFVTITRMT